MGTVPPRNGANILTTSTATQGARARARRRVEQPLPEVLASMLLSDGTPAWLVASTSDPSRPWVVTERGPSGQVVCGMPGQAGCPASAHGRRCHHVDAVCAAILHDEYVQLRAKMAATAEIARKTDAALARVRVSLDAADRRDHSAPRPMNDPAVLPAFSVWK